MQRTHTALLVLLFTLALPLYAQASPYNALGDTLTVIQQPILNIPAIHIPGEQMQIICTAPSSTTNWQAWLIHGSKSIPLELTSTLQLENPPRWQLNTIIPQVPVFELYDLRVSASGGLDDTTWNAVQVIPSRKTSYYFAHITDAHMPGRTFYPDNGFASDSTSVVDFREVVKDINIIRPEFVLFTGDVINEGELEGFAGMYSFGWAQRAIAELEVPVFITAGNHDIGGWTNTPPPAGSARRNWWRYFGWKWLDNADSNWHTHTQNYFFSYGDLLYVGLEAYDNYDNWRSYIYGGQSFIYSQLSWLNQTLSLYPDKTKVLFHHYDFSDQLNLNNLGISLSLWGHIHRNQGSISTFPYDLSTRSVTDGNRSYRMVRVNNATVAPQTTIYATSLSQTDNLFINYYPSNTAVSDSIMAIVTNNQSFAFENALVKFLMPSGNQAYSVTGGVLEQVDRSGSHNVCYVRVNLTANSVKYVSIATSGVSNDDPSASPGASLLGALYPNPFSDRLNIALNDSKSISYVRIFNQRGALVRSLDPGDYNSWDGLDSQGRACPAGIYFVKVSSGDRIESRKVLKIRD